MKIGLYFLITNFTISQASAQQTRSLIINDDLNAFDIVVQKSTTAPLEKSAEFDFFKDMEPVIQSRSSVTIPPHNFTTNSPKIAIKSSNKIDTDDIVIDSSRFAAVAINADDNTANGDGWGMDDDVEDAWKE